MRFVKPFVVLLLLLVLAACSLPPGDQTVQNEVTRHLLADGGDKLFDVISVKRLNGFAQGDNEYVVDVEYTLKFKVGTRDLSWIGEQTGEGGKDPRGPLEMLGKALGSMALAMQHGSFEAGDTRSREESFVFRKTEQGWQIR